MKEYVKNLVCLELRKLADSLPLDTIKDFFKVNILKIQDVPQNMKYDKQALLF